MKSKASKYQKVIEERLQYIIGFTQMTLIRDQKALWIASQIFSTLQKIGILKLIFHMQDIRNINQMNSSEYSQDLLLIFKIVSPTVYITENLSYVYLFACQLTLFVLLLIPMSMVTLHMSEEIELFNLNTYKSKNQLNVSQNENISDLVQSMHQIYNYHNYIENFQHKLLQDSSLNSLKMIALSQIALYLNYFPHIFLIPLLYFMLEVDLISVNSPPFFQMIMLIMNLLIGLLVIICTLISIFWVQVSYTLNDSNYLRLSQSYLEFMHLILILIPLLLTFLLVSSGMHIETDSYIHIFNKIFIMLAFTVEAYDSYINMPFLKVYKTSTQLIMRAIALSIVFLTLTDFSDQQIINLTFIVSPFIAKILIQVKASRVEMILNDSLKKEKVVSMKDLRKKKSQITSSVYQETETNELIRIENDNFIYKEYQSATLKSHDLKYFIHFLSLILQMNLQEVGVLTRNSYSKLEPIRSRFLMYCIVLLKTHSENCVNQYCFCKGIKGERRRIIEKHEIVKEMKMYDDFKILNIQFYIELIMRYLRDYTKLVFQVESRKQSPNIMFLLQILIFLSNSDECYQAQLLILELKIKLGKQSKIEERMAMELLLSYSKFQILNRLKEGIQRNDIELTLKYQDYRLTELKRDKLLGYIFQILEFKKNQLKLFNENQHTYETIEELFINTYQKINEIEKQLIYFKTTSLSKTSLYCYMFFCLEITNNYDQFIKLCNQNNTRESKFFEYPSFHYRTEEQASRVGFLQTNLASAQGTAKRGEIMQFSKQIPQFLGFTYQEFQQIKVIDQLCYPSLVRPHDEMIEIFVLTNRPNMLRTPLNLIVQKKSPGLLQQLEIFIDISFNFTQNILPCYCFLKEIKKSLRQDNQGGYLLVDMNLRVEGVTVPLLQALELESHTILYNKRITDILPIFDNIQMNLQDKVDRYMETNRQIDETFIPSGQTITTSDSLVQSFATCYDSTELIVQYPQNTQIKFQIDLEATLQYSKVNKLTYKVYYLKIKNPLKLGAQCSEMSSISKSLDEYSEDSYQMVKLEEYCKQGEVNQYQDEQIIHDPLTLRDQQNQFELEEQAPLQIYNQQDFLNSDHSDQESQRNSDVKDEDDQSQDQQRIYINSLSSASSRQSEIQRIITKSHFFRAFAELNNIPHLLYAIFALNLFSLIAIFSFTITATALYNLWQQNTKTNIYILQAFSMTDYSRATIQGSMIYVQYIQENFNVSSLMQKEFNYNQTLLDQLYTILNLNINDFQDKMDTQSENTIIRQVFSSTNLIQMDIFKNENTEVKGWTALFQLMYIMNQLKVVNSNNFYQFQKSIYYLLQSYQQYNLAYGVLNKRFTDEITGILTSYNYTIDYVSFICLGVFFCYLIISILYQHSYYQLLKKYLRCCEQISHMAIENEILHTDYLIATYKSLENFDLYEYHFSLKDKYQVEDEEQINLYKSSSLQIPSNKKVIKINNKVNVKRQLSFIVYNISFIITICVLFLQRANDKALIQDLSYNLEIYQKCITFTESIAEASLTNFALQASPILLNQGILDNKDPNSFFQYTQESYDTANQILGEILYSNNLVGQQLKELFSSDICAMTKEQTLCEQLHDGQLKEGLLVPQQDIFDILRENIAQYQIDGTAPLHLEISEILSQNFMIDAIQSFVSDVRLQIESKISDTNVQKIITWSIFYIALFGINISQIVLIQKYVYYKLYAIRQFVYFLPPKALYVEDSFFKTITFIQKIENKIFHF